jgi:hypothetical protein
MADYRTHFLLLVTGTAEQIACLRALHEATVNLIPEQEFDFDREADPGEDVELGEDAAEAMLVLTRELAGQFERLYDPGIGIGPYEPEFGGALLYSEDGCGSPHYTAHLLRHHLRHIGSDAVISFCWSLTCSPPRLDGFGGGAAVATRNRVELLDTFSYLEERGCQVG